jgi:hypothetical protein
MSTSAENSPIVDLDPEILDTLTKDRESFKRIEAKLDLLLEQLKELPEQIEEFVIRIEDAARDNSEEWR